MADIFSGFNAVRKNPPKSSTNMVLDSIFENQTKKRDTDYAVRKTVGSQMAMEKFKNANPSELEKSQTSLNRAKERESLNPSARQLLSFNPETQQMEVVGQFSKGDVIRNTRSMPLEKMQSMQSGDIVKANFQTMLKDMEKDPSLLFKVQTPLVGNAYSAARTTYESAVKEMLSETGGKTLTQSEQRVAKSTIPGVKDWLVSKSAGREDDANIAARAALKIMAELRTRATTRLRQNDMNAAPEFGADDIQRLRQEAAQEYAQLKQNNFSGLTGRADTATDATDTSNIDYEKEKEDAMQEIANRPGAKKAIIAEYRRITGRNDLT